MNQWDKGDRTTPGGRALFALVHGVDLTPEEDVFDDDDGGCWDCHGAGGFHDCGEDSCCCLDPDEITEVCRTCGGSGEVHP